MDDYVDIMEVADQPAPKIKKTMTEGSIWKKILRFAFPIMLSNMFNQFFTAGDSIISGKFIGHEALAAVGSNNSTINVMICLFLGLGVGGGVIVAQYYGAKDSENVRKAVHTIMLVAFISGIILTIAGYFLAKPILRLLSTPDDVLALSTQYLQIYFLGVSFVIIYNVGAGILRATGKSFTPFLWLAISCVMDLGLNIWFIVGLGWGIAGAAWSTVISYAFASACVILQLSLTRGAHRLSVKHLRFDKKMLIKMLKIGLPIGLQTAMYSVANVLIQANLNKLGSEVMAGWTAANKVDTFAFAPVSAFGAAINTFAGQNYGAREHGRIKKGMFTTSLMAEITAVIMLTPLLIFSKQIIALFNDKPAVIEYGRQIMFMVMPVYTIFGLSEVLSGTLKGVGRTIESAVMSFTGILAVRMIWLYAVFPSYGTTTVLFWVHPVSWIVTAVIFILYFVIMGWNRILGLGKKRGELFKCPPPAQPQTKQPKPVEPSEAPQPTVK